MYVFNVNLAYNLTCILNYTYSKLRRILERDLFFFRFLFWTAILDEVWEQFEWHRLLKIWTVYRETPDKKGAFRDSTKERVI